MNNESPCVCVQWLVVAGSECHAVAYTHAQQSEKEDTTLLCDRSLATVPWQLLPSNANKHTSSLLGGPGSFFLSQLAIRVF